MISVNYQPGISAEEILVYIGTVLIALGVVGVIGGSGLLDGIKDLRAFCFGILAWPLRHFINEMYKENNPFEAIKTLNGLSKIRKSYATFFIIIMFFITTVFQILGVILLPLELLQVFFDKTYLKIQEEYEPTYNVLIKNTLTISFAPLKITPKKVKSELKKRKIPVLPIIGVILITIAFIMQIT
jgi:hypothetical protein